MLVGCSAGANKDESNDLCYKQVGPPEHKLVS